MLACGLGLAMPDLASLPNESTIVALAMLMFVSCYKLRDGGFSDVNWHHALTFYIIRFCLLPFAFYAAALPIIPEYAIGIFLLTALPTGASCTAFINIYGGTVAIGFVMVFVSQVLTPIIIPLQFMLIGNEHIDVSPAQLFNTLLLCIVLPMILYALVRKHKPSANYFYDQNKIFSILIIFFVIALIVSKQRDVILATPLKLLLPLSLVIICYVLYLIIGWFLSKGKREVRIAYSACSGFNNAALGVSLSLLYFPPPIVLFFCCC